jgi:predicted nucleotidyltransferase
MSGEETPTFAPDGNGRSEMKRNEIPIPMERVRESCERNHVRKLSLFGSVLRDDFTPDSDVDVLIEFQPGHSVGFIRLGMIEEELSALLNRRVDLNTPGLLSPYFREEVPSETETIYDAALKQVFENWNAGQPDT